MSYQETNYVTEQILDLLFNFKEFPGISTGLLKLLEKWQTSTDVWSSKTHLVNLFLRENKEYDQEYWQETLAHFAGIIKLFPASQWLASLTQARTLFQEDVHQ